MSNAKVKIENFHLSGSVRVPLVEPQFTSERGGYIEYTLFLDPNLARPAPSEGLTAPIHVMTGIHNILSQMAVQTEDTLAAAHKEFGERAVELYGCPVVAVVMAFTHANGESQRDSYGLNATFRPA